AGSGSGGTLRAATDEQAPRWYGGRNEVERTVAAVAEVAAACGVPPAQIALAWLLAKPGVVSPLVGMSKPHHLQDALAALDLRLSPEDVAALEAPMAHAVRPERW
ncbi:aldo/keto reductase, partial [Serratia nematodiphila]